MVFMFRVKKGVSKLQIASRSRKIRTICRCRGGAGLLSVLAFLISELLGPPLDLFIDFISAANDTPSLSASPSQLIFESCLPRGRRRSKRSHTSRYFCNTSLMSKHSRKLEKTTLMLRRRIRQQLAHNILTLYYYAPNEKQEIPP